MKKRNALPVLAMICAAAAGFICSCSGKISEKTDDGSISINISVKEGEFSLKPFLQWDSAIDGVRKFMNENYADWNAANDGNPVFEQTTRFWKISYATGKLDATFYFNDEKGSKLLIAEFNYFGTDNLKPLQDEMERLGFKYKGQLHFDDFNADVCHLYLSPDEELEVQISGWQKEGGSWSISFQPFDKDDLNFL